MSPLTRSHARRGRRTCWPVHTRSSPTLTSAHGKSQTQVRKWKRMMSSVCVVLCFHVSLPGPFLTSLPDPSCGPIPRIQSGYSLLCNSVILYQCHSGFKLLGSSSVSCDPQSHQWSPAPPTCQGTKPEVEPGHMTGVDMPFLKTSVSQYGLCEQNHIQQNSSSQQGPFCSCSGASHDLIR